MEVTLRNLDVNKETMKYMKQLGNDELYAVRRVVVLVADKW